MAISQKKSRRKPSGARYKQVFSKKLGELGSGPSLTRLGKERKRQIRVLGANNKVKLLLTENANVLDPKTRKHKVVKIKAVAENVANPNFVRRNIITRGAVINTDLGKAKVTSRPGQMGVVQAVLV